MNSIGHSLLIRVYARANDSSLKLLIRLVVHTSKGMEYFVYNIAHYSLYSTRALINLVF